MSRPAVVTLLLLALPAAGRAEDYVPDVKAVASSEQVAGLTAAANLVNDRGLTRTPAGLVLTANDHAGGGCMYASNYLPGGPQEHPLIDFDLGRVTAVAGVRVWNHNGNPGRGFAEVALYASDDGTTWRTVPHRLALAKAPNKDGYAGQLVTFPTPVVARYVRFWAEATHRSGGNPDIAGLGKVRFLPAPPGSMPAAPVPPVGPYPADAGVVDVTAPPYSAKGDGVTDDTAALTRAVRATQGTRRVMVLPAGTYLVSDTVQWQPGGGYGFNVVRGAGPGNTVIRLKDRTFTDPANPRAVVANGFHGTPDGSEVSADWFHNHFTDFAVHTGTGNPGAVGVRFYSNNLGLLKNVSVTGGDPAGPIGLDLGHVDQNGPLLVKNVTAAGFATGVRAGQTVNSQTLDGVRVTGHTAAAVRNDGQCLTIRGLTSSGTGPAVVSSYGVLTLLDADLTGTGPAAVVSGEVLFARDIKTAGFAAAVRNDAPGGTPSPAGVTVGEFVSHPAAVLGGAPGRSLGLAVRDTPEPAADPPGGWANARHHRNVTDPDDTAAVQRAIDSGAATVYLPVGPEFVLSGPVEVRGAVGRVAGMFSRVRPVAAPGKPAPVVRVAAGKPAAVFLDDLLAAVRVENPSGRRLVCRNCELVGGTPADRGETFFENVVAEWTVGRGQRVWARQLNSEPEGVHVTNAGGALWVLGLKTERGGVLIDTLAGGSTEVLGGLCYTTTAGKLGPMLRVAAGGRLSATLGEVCYSGDPYTRLVEWAGPGGVTGLGRGRSPLRPAHLGGSAVPLVRAGE